MQQSTTIYFPLYISLYIWNQLKGKRFWPLVISNRSCEVSGLIFGRMDFREVWLRLYFFKCFLANHGLWNKLFQWNCWLKITKCTLKKSHICSVDLIIRGGNMLSLYMLLESSTAINSRKYRKRYIFHIFQKSSSWWESEDYLIDFLTIRFTLHLHLLLWKTFIEY